MALQLQKVYATGWRSGGTMVEMFDREEGGDRRRGNLSELNTGTVYGG